MGDVAEAGQVVGRSLSWSFWSCAYCERRHDIGDEIVDRERPRQQALRRRDVDRDLEIPAIRLESNRRRIAVEPHVPASSRLLRNSPNSSRMAVLVLALLIRARR